MLGLLLSLDLGPESCILVPDPAQAIDYTKGIIDCVEHFGQQAEINGTFHRTMWVVVGRGGRQFYRVIGLQSNISSRARKPGPRLGISA